MNETERPMILEMTSVWQETLNWQPTAVQQQLFQRLYEGILAVNESLNVTRITESDAFW